MPEGKRLNGGRNDIRDYDLYFTYVSSDPLSIEEAVKVSDEMSKLPDETLLLVANHLNIPTMEITSSKGDKWRYCLKMIFTWEDLTKQNEEEASKKALAIKLMNAANEIYTKNKEESKKLEIIARGLNFQGNKCLHEHTKAFMYLEKVYGIMYVCRLVSTMLFYLLNERNELFKLGVIFLKLIDIIC